MLTRCKTKKSASCSSFPGSASASSIIGTTDVPHHGDAATAHCSDEEAAYLLAAYNRYFAHPGGAATEADIVFTWSGVRTLEDDASTKPSRISRSPALSSVANGAGGFVTLYGGKLTTHRALAEEVVDALRKLGARRRSLDQERSTVSAGPSPGQNCSPAPREDPKASPWRPASDGPSLMAIRSRPCSRRSPPTLAWRKRSLPA